MLAASSSKRSQCQSLRGVDRAPDRNVKLVKRFNRDRSRGSNLVGCVLPRGRLYTIATRKGVDNDLAQEFGYMIRQVAGRIVLLDTYGTEGGYGSNMSTMVWNLSSGRSYTIASSCFGKDVSCFAEYDNTRKAIVTRDGRSVAALEHFRAGEPSSTTLIAGFTSDGMRRVLDAGAPSELPAASLTLTGNIVAWTHAGALRAARL